MHVPMSMPADLAVLTSLVLQDLEAPFLLLF